MAKEDLTLVRILKFGKHGKDVVAVKRMIARADVGFPKPVKEANGKINNRFARQLESAVKRFQRRNGLDPDGEIGYHTFKSLVRFADAFDSHLLREFVRDAMGDWGLLGLKTSFNGLDMGVDFKGAGPIPMFADGEVVRIARKDSGWPGIGGLIVVQCDKGPMSKFPIYTAEDIAIPKTHKVGTRLKQGELLCDATGTNQAPGIEIGWAGPAPAFFSTLFVARHGSYSGIPRATAEGTNFFHTLSAWMAKDVKKVDKDD